MASRVKETLQCEHCGQKFRKSFNLNRHVKAVHSEQKTFRCGQCDKVFSRKEHLIQHEQTHSKTALFTCDICDKMFSCADYLRRHKQRQHKTNIYRCDKCTKTFASRVEFIRHQRSGHNDVMYRCDICNKTFTREDKLIIHNEREHTEYICTECGDKFNNMSMLNTHRQNHHSASIQTGQGLSTRRIQRTEPPQNKNNEHDFSDDPKMMPKDVYPKEIIDDDQRKVYEDHWKQIMTMHSRNNKLQDRYNFRLDNLSHEKLAIYLNKIFHEQRYVFKLNLSFGFILKNNETGEFKYFHSSINNHRYLDKPALISNEDDLSHFIKTNLENIDVLEYARLQRPNSKWVVDIITNVTFFVSKVKGHPIGSGPKLPSFIVKNKSIVALHRDNQTGKAYEDNLCFFRCLAVHNGCHAKNLKKATKHYFDKYLQITGTSKNSFEGVTLEDLPVLEKIFEVNIFVYCLIRKHQTDDFSSEGELSQVHEVAELVQRSHRHYDNTMYLNLYGKHFSFISDIKRVCKSFCCSKCDRLWKHVGKLHRNERTCEANVKHVFPGGTFNLPQTIFDQLNDEGIHVPKHLQYFPHRATFDFECSFNYLPSDYEGNTEKLHWEAKHIPLSVSICSNIPHFTRPKCFVSDGDSNKLISDMMGYLIEVSKSSYLILLEQFEGIFSQIDEKLDEERSTQVSFDCGEKDDGSDCEEFCCERVSDDEQDNSDDDDSDSESDDDVSDRSVINLRADEYDYDEIQELLKEARADNIDTDLLIDKDELQNEHKDKPCKNKKHPLESLKEKLDSYLKELPVLGFNSGKYDINAVKQYLLPYLVKNEPVLFTVKKNNSHMCIKTEHLKFLDITNYLAPNFSYADFLKAYEVEQTKGFFPYQWMDNLEKLNHTSLPPHEAFFTSLRNENISLEEYQYCQQVWEDNQMNSFKDFLIWYNNLDVEPFLQAVDKMFLFWKERGIDMFKHGVSVPGLTMKYLFTDLKTYFSLFDDKNSDLYRTFKNNLVGGPSIIFHRYHEKGKTFIREREMKAQGKKPELCQKIVGFDANALYLWAIMQPMPTKHYTRRLAEDGFKPRHCRKVAHEWLEWVAHSQNIHIRHQHNNTEKRIGGRRLPVDGFYTDSSGKSTVFQYQGCYWHGHQCHLNQKHINETRQIPMKELYAETERNRKYIESLGYNYVEIWECEWLRMKSESQAIQDFIQQKFSRPLDSKMTMTETEIEQAILDDKLFGCIECDIHVPDILKPKFAEMPPIFKNIEIDRNDIGEYMRTFGEANGIMNQPRRSLIGSMKGEKILLTSNLVKFYLQKGLKITKIYQVVEFSPDPCFHGFGEAVSDARRAGDVDPSKAIIADTMKLVGNSSYGKSLTNKELHRNVKYCDDDCAPRLVNDPFFRQLDPINEDTYEVLLSKKSIRLDLPLQIGFFVYSYAKLRMLQFYFDFMVKYFDPKDWQYCEKDTDSAYIAISGDNIDDIVMPHMKDEYLADRNNWFPREDTRDHYNFDRRTPGLYKVEWEGSGIIGLCSKTYYCFGQTKDKFSCKGVNKKVSDIDKDKYLNVLLTKTSGQGTNKGFRVRENAMYTYTQVRDAFSYFYPKRKVLDDGISTTYLDI